MDRGTYIAASGGLLQLKRMEIVNNNLANVNTPGFKGQMLISRTRDFDETLASEIATDDPYAEGDHQRSPDAVSVRTVTDFTQGPIQATGNPLDVALSGPNDFFVVNTEDGDHYTRAGNFTLNSQGELVTNDGNRVQGDGGAIVVNGAKVTINQSGDVTVDGENVGRLRVVRFETPEDLIRVGANRFKLGPGSGQPPALEDANLVTSSLEMSNVSAVRSMLDLIATNRGFEMYTKTAKALDEMNQQSITQIGRSR